MRRASSGNRSPTSSVELSTWRTARNHCDCSVIWVLPSLRVGSSDAAWRETFRRGALGGFLQRADARLEHVEELAGVEASLAALEAAREPDLDALVRIADRVVEDAGARPFGGAVAGLLDQLAHGAFEHGLAGLELA